MHQKYLELLSDLRGTTLSQILIFSFPETAVESMKTFNEKKAPGAR